jgi:drug/metabolite transporter (DMT)-like permease
VSVQTPGLVGPVALFAITTAIWGSTWLGIKFQLGVVPPQASVVYRFAIAAAVLALACVARGRSLAFAPRTHVWLAAQGMTFFGLNYVAVYVAESYVTSGLVAVAFSTISFMTPIGARLAFGTPIAARTSIGAALGVAGVALLFLPELRTDKTGGDPALGIAYAFAATAIATVGNLVSIRLQRDRVPLFTGTAWGMAYGAATAAVAATIAGTAWTFDLRWPYVASLVYLALFGSIVAFVAYFLLLRQVGAAPASFLGVSTPVVAMLLSTLFEGYQWTWVAAIGVALAVGGIVLALGGKRDRQTAGS